MAPSTTDADKKLTDDHKNHAQHLCELVAKRQMGKVGALTKDAKHVCHICGRGSAEADNLCDPVKI